MNEIDPLLEKWSPMLSKWGDESLNPVLLAALLENEARFYESQKTSLQRFVEGVG